MCRSSNYLFFIFFYIRDKNHCQTSFTTTLDMKQNDVVYGSKVGNTTNPQYLKVVNWVTCLIIVHLNIYFCLDFDNTYLSDVFHFDRMVQIN